MSTSSDREAQSIPPCFFQRIFFTLSPASLIFSFSYPSQAGSCVFLHGPNGCACIPSMKNKHLSFPVGRKTCNRASVILSRHRSTYCGGKQTSCASAGLLKGATKYVLIRTARKGNYGYRV